MGENTLIQWAHHTFNPWVGCQRVSPGCTNCYAEALDRRFGGAVIDGQKVLRWGPKAPRVKTSKSNWKQPLRWNKAAEAAGERHRVFCASLADVFEDREELVQWRRELFELIDATPNLDWLLLSKRPENIMAMLPWGWISGFEQGLVVPNVWFGTTVEDQERADARIHALLKVPAKVRFLSCEPLLEFVDLGLAGRLPRTEHPRIDWVIIGGESGPGARPFAIDWARDLVRQCRASGASPFVKQLGANPMEFTYDGMNSDEVDLKDSHGGDWDEWPADLRIREVPR
jgi:protein gp37